MKYLVGIDPGTSGVKCLVMDETGKVVKSVTREYPLYTPKPAWSEQDPADWWNGTKDALQEMLKDVDKTKIVAVGFSGQMHGLVALDENNNVIRRAILWNDQRTGAECEEIVNTAGGMDGLVSYTNNNMLTGYTGGKLLWLKKHEPENFAKMKRFLMPKDYVRLLLTGVAATDVSEASGVGLFDVKNRKWATALIEKLDIDSVVCITQEDDESGKYREADKEERILMEIPVRYSSLRWKKLKQLDVGSHPFVVPDIAYSSERGLDLAKTGAENYDTNYQIW